MFTSLYHNRQPSHCSDPVACVGTGHCPIDQLLVWLLRYHLITSPGCHLDVTWMLWWPGVASKVGTKLREFAPPRVVFGSLGRCWGGVCIPNHIVAMWNVVETLPIVLWLGTWVHQIAYFCQNWSRPLMTLGFHSEIFWSWCGECFENYIIACGDYAILFATCIADDEQHEYLRII